MAENTSMSESQHIDVKVDGQTTQGEVLPQTNLEVGSLVENHGLERTPEGTPVATAESNIGEGFKPVEGSLTQPKPEQTPTDQLANPNVVGGIKE